jgi:hypothetical protein
MNCGVYAEGARPHQETPSRHMDHALADLALHKQADHKHQHFVGKLNTPSGLHSVLAECKQTSRHPVQTRVQFPSA